MAITAEVLDKEIVDIKVDLGGLSSSYDFGENKSVEFGQLSEDEIDDKMISEHKESMKNDTFIDITDL